MESVILDRSVQPLQEPPLLLRRQTYLDREVEDPAALLGRKAVGVAQEPHPILLRSDEEAVRLSDQLPELLQVILVVAVVVVVDDQLLRLRIELPHLVEEVVRVGNTCNGGDS